MQQFISLNDVKSARLPLTLGALTEHILEVDDCEQGLVEPFGRPFSSIPFEAIPLVDISVSYLRKFVCSNQCCITLVVPYRREIIKEELS